MGWFAIQVVPGSETRALETLRTTAKRAGLEELFAPKAVKLVKSGAEWVEAVEPLIPDCIVAVAPSEREVRACVRRARGMEDLLEGDSTTTAMRESEVELISMLTEPGSRTVGLSQGVVDCGRVVVQSGPLLGREELVRRVSHRKRSAYLDASVAGKPATAEVGLRVTRKEAKTN